jgi:hypothetical protein
MSTYSYSTPPTDATNLNDITAILNQLPDNTSKQITPKDVRDAIFSTWENIIFKPTGLTSGHGYIGLDSGINGLTQSKVYFGKRRASGKDVMNPTLLGSNTDFFFFNNKSDTATQNTKISILSGTNSSLYSLAPYLESKIVNGLSYSYIDLNIINNSTDSNGLYGGNINIGTDGVRGYTAGGNVSINGMIFPKYIAPNSPEANAIDGYVLKYNSNGYLTWESSAGTIDNITSSGTVSIIGSPVLINNQETNFLTDATPVVQAIGSIPVGYTFSNENIVEVVRKIIYPYLSPQVSMVLNATPIGTNPPSYTTSGTNNLIVEMGNVATFTYTYTITKRSNNITSVTSVNLWNLPGVPITSTVTSTRTNNPSAAEVSIFGTKTFTLTVSDGTSSDSSSATIRKILPFFYGTSTTVVNFNSFQSIVSSLTKNVKDKSDTTVPLSGNNVCIYFAYPSLHGTLSAIIDNNGFDITSSFSTSLISINSPEGYWSLQNYRVYIYTSGGTSPATTSVGLPPTYLNPVNYQFKFF